MRRPEWLGQCVRLRSSKDEVREGQITQGIVSMLTSQGSELKSDMIKFSFKRVMLAIVWRIN